MAASFGAGRFWGDTGDGEGRTLLHWNPEALAHLWRDQAHPTNQETSRKDGDHRGEPPVKGAIPAGLGNGSKLSHGPHGQPQELPRVERQAEPMEPVEVVELPEPGKMESPSRAQRRPLHAAVDSDSNDTPDGQDEEPRETSSTRAPGASGAQRMVSFHLSQPDSGANDPWANFRPGKATVPPERTRLEAGSRNGQDRARDRSEPRTQGTGPRKTSGAPAGSESTTRVRLGKDLAQSWTTREILHAAELHLEEFDVVHAVVALHRIAKSTDRGELRHDQRLTAILAKLAATAAEATTVSPSDNEMPHVKEVSKALWALAKVGPWADNFEGYGPRGLESGSWSGRAWTGVHRSLKALGTSAIGRLHELDSHGLSNVAWSLAVARFDQRGFVTAIARSALQLLPDFQAQGLANTAWAMAHLLAEPEGRGPERKLLESIAKEVGRNAHDFTPQGLANIGWAFATLALRHEHLMDAVARELAEGAGNWSQQNLANILWAFAKVAVQPRPGAIRAVVDDALLTIQSWSALNIANLTWSFAKLAVRHQELFAAVETECQQKLLHFSSQNLVNVAWAFAKVVLARQHFFERVARRAVELAPDFNPQNCSNAVWAFAAVGLASPHLLAATARRAEELAPELQAQDLANLAWAFAKLGRRDAALEETVASEVVQKVDSFSPQHLSIIVYSFAQLLAAGAGSTAGLQAMPRVFGEDLRRSNMAPAPSTPAMVEAILSAASKRVREFDAQGLTNLAQSLAKLEIQREGLHNALVEEATPKISTFTNQEPV
ncbi:RAP, partial [Symbiodinium natans]